MLGATATVQSPRAERAAPVGEERATPNRTAEAKKATKRPAAKPRPAEPEGTGPSGRSDGVVVRARERVTEALTTTASNAYLAPLLLISLALVLAAATAPAVAGSRFSFRLRPMLEHRAYFAVMGLAGLTAWIAVALGSTW